MIVGLLSSLEPQMSAANWKTFSRISPSVAPGLFPLMAAGTFAAGVGSLNPSPGPSTLRMVIVTSAKAAAGRSSDDQERRPEEASFSSWRYSVSLPLGAPSRNASALAQSLTQAVVIEPSGLVRESHHMLELAVEVEDLAPVAVALVFRPSPERVF